MPSSKLHQHKTADIMDYKDIAAEFDPTIKNILPHTTMYTLEIGSERFVLSGASLSSDAPSYFTNFFSNSGNANQVLYIDRSPKIFAWIYAHLQGYHVEIPDADTFTGLFFDALYYNLPQLRQNILQSEYHFANIGNESLRVPKRLLATPGNSPNFFTVASEALFKDITAMMPTRRWIRPPPQASITLNRCPILFRELINVLQGVEPEIRSAEHRRSLIKEARYYRFNGLVQKLIPSKVVYNPFQHREELVIDVEHVDIKCLLPGCDYVLYKRAYTEEEPRVLVVKVTEPEVVIEHGSVIIHGAALKRLSKLFGSCLNGAQLKVSSIEPQPMYPTICAEKSLMRFTKDNQVELTVVKSSTDETQWASSVLF